MAHTQTTATDLADLVAQLVTFLTANGWTGGGLEVTNSSGQTYRFVLGGNVVRNGYGDDDYTDRYLYVNHKYASYGIAGTYGPNAGSNDFFGPFLSAWFFTDGDSAAVVAQTGATRYTHLLFGRVNDNGLYDDPAGVIAGLSYEYWRSIENYRNDEDCGYNYVTSTHHAIGFFEGGAYSHTVVPNGVADPALGLPAGAFATTSILPNSDRRAWRGSSWENGDFAGPYSLDYFPGVANQNVTGGVVLSPLPWVYSNGSQYLYLGELPLIRLCDFVGLSPGQTLTYGADEWLVFPLKQYGDPSAQNFGQTPAPHCNTGYYGFAYPKGT